MNSRKCEVCDIDSHRASYVKHLRSKEHLENIKQNEVIRSECLVNEPILNKIIKIINPKTMKQIARDIIGLDDKQINKDLHKKTLDPYYITDRNLRVGFKIDLDSHHINQSNSKLTITPKYP